MHESPSRNTSSRGYSKDKIKNVPKKLKIGHTGVLNQTFDSTSSEVADTYSGLLQANKLKDCLEDISIAAE